MNLENSNFLAAILLFAMVAVLCGILSVYAQPFADDYCHAFDMHSAGDLASYVSHNWQSLNGRWATTIFRYFNDLVIGLGARYWLTTPIALTFIFLGFWFFIATFVDELKSRIAFASVMSMIFIAIASKISDLLFWSTGITDYTVGYFLTGLSCYLLISSAQSSSSKLGWRLPTTSILLFFNAGLSELFLIPLGLLLAYLVISNGWINRFLLPSTSFAIGAILNIFAPGNSARLARVDHAFDIEMFLRDVSLYGARGLLLPITAMFLISHVPFIRSLLSNLTRRCNELPLMHRYLITTFVLLYPIIIIVSLVLSLGSPGPGRAHNVSLFALVLSWPIVVTQLKFLRPKNFKSIAMRWVLPTLGILVLLMINTKDLVEDIVSGDAKAYSASVNLARATLARPDNQGREVVVSNTAKRPNIASGSSFLVSTDENLWVNQCIAMYHGNSSVKLSQ